MVAGDDILEDRGQERDEVLPADDGILARGVDRCVDADVLDEHVEPFVPALLIHQAEVTRLQLTDLLDVRESCIGHVVPLSGPAGLNRPIRQRTATSKSAGSMAAVRSPNSSIENGHWVTMRPEGDR